MTNYAFTPLVTDSIGRQATSPQVVGLGTIVTLLHFDGTNASTTFTDATGRVWTRVSTPTISTAQSVFGGASGSFSGTQYITTPDSADFAFGADDFTIEFRARPTSLTGGSEFRGILTQRDTNGGPQNAFSIYYGQLNGGFAFEFTQNGVAGSGTGGVVSNFALAINTWYAVAVCRNNNTIRLFVDGTLRATADCTGMTFFDGTGVIKIGTLDTSAPSSSKSWQGFLEELRVVKGAGLYTANYTPAASAFSYP